MRYTDICSKWLFPFQCYLKGHDVVVWRDFLEQSQWWSLEKLNSYAQKRHEALLTYVQEQTPYYASHNDFPLINKQILRNDFQAFKSAGNEACNLQRTGGSTGEPLYFLISKNRIAHDVAAKWRATRWFDVDIGDREMVFWGSPIEVSRQSLLRKCRDYLFRSHLIPARNLDSEALMHILKQMQSYSPRMLFGYPSLLALLAKYADKHHYKVNELGVKVAFVTSEVLDPAQRDLIETVFGCKVANGYGGRESGFIAHECPEGNMHITMEDIHVELIDEAGQICSPGELGEVVITHFETKAFPFIRYRTGDYAMFKETSCSCGRQLKILSHLEGRKSDLIFSQSGAIIHRAEIVSILTAEPKIEQFQVIQTSLTEFFVKIKGNGISEHALGVLKRNLQKLIGMDVEIKFEFVNAFQSEASGKFKFITSKVAEGMF